MACLSGWIIALATLVGLLATAHLFWSSDLQITFVQFLTTVRSHTCEFSDGLLVSLNNYTGHTCWAFLHCVSSYDFSDDLIGRLNSCTGHTCRASFRCAPSHVFWGGMLEWMNNWRTLVTLEGLLSTVRSHVAFQMTCLRGWIDALITLVWLLTTVCFKTPYLSWRECAHWLHLFSFSPVCVLICLLRWLAVDDEKEHWLHLWDSIRVFANSWSSSIIICFLFDPLILYCLTQTEERWKASKKRKWKFWKSLVFLSPVSVSAWNSFRELLLLLD